MFGGELHHSGIGSDIYYNELLYCGDGRGGEASLNVVVEATHLHDSRGGEAFDLKGSTNSLGVCVGRITPQSQGAITAQRARCCVGQTR